MKSQGWDAGSGTCSLRWIAVLAAVAALALAAGWSARTESAGARSFLPDRGAAEQIDPVAGVSATFLSRKYWWKKRRITYWDGTRNLGPMIDRAAKAWNRSGANIKWIKVKSRRRAQVPTVRSNRIFSSGQASIFLSPSGHRTDLIRVRGIRRYGPRMPLRELAVGTLLLTHEMGHTMGLNHSGAKCAVMQPSVSCVDPSPARPWQYRCGILTRDDLRGIRKIRGGKVRKPGPLWCGRKPSAPPPVNGLAVTLDPGPVDDPYYGAILGARWKVPRSGGIRRLLVAYNHSDRGCPKSPVKGYDYEDWWEAKPRAGTQVWTSKSTLSPGTYCLAVFSKKSQWLLRHSYLFEAWSVRATRKFRVPEPVWPEEPVSPEDEW